MLDFIKGLVWEAGYSSIYLNTSRGDGEWIVLIC